jgi:hypothetical protein
MHLRDGQQRHFQLAADSEDDMQEWISVVGTAIDVLKVRDAPASPAQLASVYKAMGLEVDDNHSVAIGLSIDRLVPIPGQEGDSKLLKKASYRLVVKMFTRTSKNRAVWRKKTKWKRQLERGESSAQTQSRPMVFDEVHHITRGVEPSR